MTSVSIITVSYNNVNTIEKTIQSVLSQTYKNIQFIVIDGNSNDGTYQIIESYNPKISQIVHETDHGIYHAMNKGLNLATSKYTLYLNADDVFAHDKVIEEMAHIAEMKDLDAVAAGVHIYKQHKLYRIYKSTRFKPWMFIIGHQPPHPGLMCKTALLKAQKGFNYAFKIAGDFDLMLRLFSVPNFKWEAINTIAVKMQHGGASSGSFEKKETMNKEIKKSLKANGKPAYSAFIWAKYIFKIFQLRGF